jgi:hypothetical protein
VGTKKSGKKKQTLCGSCTNFDADKKSGYCRHHKKKRSATDKTCGSYDPR